MSGASSDGRLSRNVKIVSLVSFFQDTASEILYPVLPFFVTGVLGAPPAVLGLIEGLADGTASVMKVASGRLADRHRRRPIVFADGFFGCAFDVFCVFRHGVPLASNPASLKL